MRGWLRALPFRDLRHATRRDLRGDFFSALTVTLMGIPQAIAYAMIAGLPPAMGLYAAFLPTVIGSLTRSSRQVVTGPTNALSLLVGTAVAGAVDVDPVGTAMVLALMVGAIQLGAGLLRLGSLVDYISLPVVLGYIAGAGILIAVGQLPNLTETAGVRGNVFEGVAGWYQNITEASLIAVLCGLSTALAIVVLKRWRDGPPWTLIVLSLWTAASALYFGDDLRTVADLSSIPKGLPAISLPAIEGWIELLPIAVAATVLSLVEASAVARALAARSGQGLDLSVEFVGQGLANLAAGVSGGYPVSGSPSRSAMNQQSGAKTRFSGVMSGLFVGAALLFFGPVVDYTPIAALAGLLLVVGAELVDLSRIRAVIAGRRSDSVAFAVTLVSTWLVPLDKAIYLGVGISLVLYLRRARLLRVTRLRVTDESLVEEGVDSCRAIKILQIDGQLFFAAASELDAVLDDSFADPQTRVVVLRLRRALGLDATIAALLAARAEQVRQHGQRLVLVGVNRSALELLKRTGAARVIGEESILAHRQMILEGVAEIYASLHADLGPHPCRPPAPDERNASAS